MGALKAGDWQDEPATHNSKLPVVKSDEIQRIFKLLGFILISRRASCILQKCSKASHFIAVHSANMILVARACLSTNFRELQTMDLGSYAPRSTNLKVLCFLAANTILFCANPQATAQSAYLRGKALVDQHKFEQAIPLLTQSIGEKTKIVNSYYKRGIAYEGIGDSENAERDFRMCLKLEPGSEDPHRRLAEIYHKDGHLDVAENEYSEALKINPASASVYYDRGLVRADRGNHKAAIADYYDAIKLDPTKDRIYKSRALSYSKINQFDKAIADYSKYLELQPDNYNAKGDRAECYVGAHRYAEALTQYSELIRLQPHNAKGYVARANLYKKMGKNDLAEKDLKAATAEGENFQL
jgi:tetratricopeptide (TPR) repeat protein